MNDTNTPFTVNFYAGTANNSPVFEELPVRKIVDNQYELLSSPGLALNLAKGDIVCVFDEHHSPKVLKRGGNFCIQIYSEHISKVALKHFTKTLQSKLNGTLDGKYMGNLAISVPAAAGLASIREFFDAFTEQTGIQWYFGNIYKNLEDANDETLLDWWL
jgi:Domain of unknown function (DUF4265)